MSTRQKRLQQFWAQEKSLTILLLILVVQIFIVIPIGQKTIVAETIFLIFYALLLSAGMFLLIKNAKLRLLLIVILIFLIFLGSDFFFKSVKLGILDDFIAVVYCILLGWVVLLRTFSEGPVTIHRIQGAIVVYLLVGLIFAMAYHSVYLLYSETAFKGLGSLDRKEFMYFSLTTLTTVGYGDISPAIPLNRSMANLEALIGQLYPAILIARLVSMEFEASKGR
ncbi:MAG TPA: potassium channel family protein [Parafilimonas sp.]|nr:potassium channel family protein [Parafilimonas sp.]